METRHSTAQSGSLVPQTGDSAIVRVDRRTLRLGHLDQVFWPGLGLIKRDLLRYYESMAEFLLPHLVGRAVVMKRYPDGVEGEYVFMKRAPSPRPPWLSTCRIELRPGNAIDFPVVNDLASLLYLVNLSCIDLNPWYGRCDSVSQPDFLHFDLDPVRGASFREVREAALLVHGALGALGMPSYAKTTGSRGIHVYVPLKRGPSQKEVWAFAKNLALSLETLEPGLITAESRIQNRPRGRVLVDYNQNAWGRTLASVYSVRPVPKATVSAPVTWRELESGLKIDDFRMDNMPARARTLGDLWKPMALQRGRFSWPPETGGESRDTAELAPREKKRA